MAYEVVEEHLRQGLTEVIGIMGRQLLEADSIEAVQGRDRLGRNRGKRSELRNRKNLGCEADFRSFEEVQLHRGPIVANCRHMTGDASVGDDLAQEEARPDAGG